jgi:hypothetical protein
MRELRELDALEAKLREVRWLRLSESQAYRACLAQLRRTMSEEISDRLVAMTTPNETLRRERDSARRERDELALELAKGREALAHERKALEDWRQVLERDRDALARWRDQLCEQRDEVLKERKQART